MNNMIINLFMSILWFKVVFFWGGDGGVWFCCWYWVFITIKLQLTKLRKYEHSFSTQNKKSIICCHYSNTKSLLLMKQIHFFFGNLRAHSLLIVAKFHLGDALPRHRGFDYMNFPKMLITWRIEFNIIWEGIYEIVS